mmetsp:Transcript_37961/g.84843  ORF Transcript_37961/g.84843 Transcript_37961/m.84843 type:complete len:204 (-) Transcript_37961:141-752(-)
MALPRALAAFALLAAWAAAQEPNVSLTVSPSLLLEEPLCGYSKRNIDEDPLRRHCLRQCILGDDSVVHPYFEEWEEYCRETAGMADWDPECQSYLCCVFGCEVWGGGSSEICDAADPVARYSFLQEARAQMFSAGITREQRCTLEKCNAYCAKKIFMTCRETQYTQQCEKSNPTLYGCDVNCNGAMSRHLGLLALLAVLRGLL